MNNGFKNAVRVLVAACALITIAQAADDLTRPLRASADGHFIAMPDGTPFFWLGDVGWSMLMRLTREETDLYLKDRAAKGFNVIQAVAVGGPLDGLEVSNRYGQRPLVDKDFKRPNPKYFEHVDWVVARAAHYGIRIAMLPVWGVGQISIYKAIDTRTARSYGQWLGERYRNRGVIWILGGDTMPMWRVQEPAGVGKQDALTEAKEISVRDDRPIYDAMAAGLTAGDGGDPFITYHPCNLSFSGTAHPRTSLYFHDRDWLDMNMLQSSHFLDPSAHNREMGADFSWIAPYSYQPIGDEYRSTPVRPVIDGEPRFEDLAIDLDEDARKGFWSGYDARAAAYQALFAGAAGHSYGNHNVWQFVDPAQRRAYELPRGTIPWQGALARASAGQMQYAKALMLSRPYFSRIPDPSLIAGDPGEGTSHIGATRDKDGSYAMAYLPQGQPVTVDLRKITGPRAIAWWFDPRTGVAKQIKGSVSTKAGVASFTPPSRGPKSDWVLVVDDESRGFGEPGIK